MTAREAWRNSRELSARIANVVRRIVGVPDYETYLRHARKHHADTTPLTQQEFVQQCWTEKYSRPGHRCC